jgi:hypothetical protein
MNLQGQPDKKLHDTLVMIFCIRQKRVNFSLRRRDMPAPFMVKNLVLLLTLGLTASLPALAAGSSKKAKSKNRQKQSQATPKEANAEVPADAAAAAEGLSSLLFPDWGHGAFDFSISPIAGFRSRQHTAATDQKISSATTEAGAAVALKNIPVIPGNPGLGASPYLGYAVGHHYERASGGELPTESLSSGFNRLWYGMDATAYLAWYRHTLGVGRGVLTYDKHFPKLQSMNIHNDAGIMVLPHFSAHYTLDLLTVYRERASAPLSKEQDHWLHGRLFTDFVNFSIDFGPGVTYTSLYNETSGTEETAKSGDYTTSYLLALMNSDLFWRFYATARVKYLINVDESLTTKMNNFIQLPTQGVNDSNTHEVMPEDSLDASFFIGANRLIGPVGGGFYYTTLVLNNSEKNGREREVYHQQGYVVNFSFSF